MYIVLTYIQIVINIGFTYIPIYLGDVLRSEKSNWNPTLKFGINKLVHSRRYRLPFLSAVFHPPRSVFLLKIVSSCPFSSAISTVIYTLDIIPSKRLKPNSHFSLKKVEITHSFFLHISVVLLPFTEQTLRTHPRLWVIFMKYERKKDIFIKTFKISNALARKQNGNSAWNIYNVESSCCINARVLIK